MERLGGKRRRRSATRKQRWPDYNLPLEIQGNIRGFFVKTSCLHRAKQNLQLPRFWDCSEREHRRLALTWKQAYLKSSSHFIKLLLVEQTAGGIASCSNAAFPFQINRDMNRTENRTRSSSKSTFLAWSERCLARS